MSMDEEAKRILDACYKARERAWAVLNEAEDPYDTARAWAALEKAQDAYEKAGGS